MGRAMSKANGSPSERVMHYFIAAFERRLNGTAYMHLTAPVRKAKKVRGILRRLTSAPVRKTKKARGRLKCLTSAPVRKARRSGDWGRCAVTFCG